MTKFLTLSAVILAAAFAAADEPQKSCMGSGEKPGCCKKTATVAMSGEEAKGCCKAGACISVDKAVADKVAAAMKDAKEVTLSGKVACEKCDLKKSEKCVQLFQSADATYVLTESKACMDMCATASHGSKTVQVKGRSVEIDGKTYLQIDSFEAAAATPAA